MFVVNVSIHLKKCQLWMVLFKLKVRTTLLIPESTCDGSDTKIIGILLVHLHNGVLEQFNGHGFGNDLIVFIKRHKHYIWPIYCTFVLVVKSKFRLKVSCLVCVFFV